MSDEKNKKNNLREKEENLNTQIPKKKEREKRREIEPSEIKERYIAHDREPYWQNFWERERVYEFNPDSDKPLFTVDTPPPTVSGALHLGHIYSYTQAEVVCRFRRMTGYNIRYPFGLDNNGLPTERLVEKDRKIKGRDTNLSKFVSTCLEVTEEYRRIYEKLWQSIGLSVDWRLEYSTISPEVQKISQSAFKELFEKGLIYRKDAPALYCTECHTSIAQAEVEDREKDSVFYDLKFTLENGDELTVATTRPELLPACVAIFVHPNDERYKNIVGKIVRTPLGNKVEVLTDEKVSLEKGSGAVMCCTYGDETDVYWAKKYNLPEKIILEKEGNFKFLDNAADLSGKKVEEGRQIMIDNLKRGDFVKGEKPIKHNVGVHERCGTAIEVLPTTQWFVKLLEMKEKILKAGEEVKWHPPFMRKRFEEWVTGLKWDWCISRERFFGTPIPAFSCDQCNEILIPEEKEFPIDPKTEEVRPCPKCAGGNLTPEKSVLDTWFTSALTPEINAASPLNGKLRDKMIPMSMRPQAHDIIRTWVVYTILMSLHRHNDIPWKDLMISGHILLRKGEKISKKSGGGKHKPEELIAEHSADAIRYAMCGASLGRDAYFDEGEVEKGRKLVTKIYNAGKLTINNSADFDPTQSVNLEATDLWIMARSKQVAAEMAKAFNEYEFGRARQIFEDFFWREFCDNYLEIIKGRLRITDENQVGKKRSAQYASYHTFLDILKMTSPFIPHITEEMYHGQFIKGKEDKDAPSFFSDENGGIFATNEKIKSIHLTDWPTKSHIKVDQEIFGGAELTLKIIAEVRKFKTINKIKMGAPLVGIVIQCSKEQAEKMLPFIEDMRFVSKTEDITFVENVDDINIGERVLINI